MRQVLKPMGCPFLLALLVICMVGVSDNSRAQIPDKFTNLKVLPGDISKKELSDTMKSMTFDLGTRCWFCHKGEGDDLSNYDFASDEKEHKQTARRHMEMTREINQKYFQGTGEDLEVNCNMCHRGQAEPQPD